jgi:1-acyl-sn-glycerol-3-phosphate acyltransferase
MDSDATVLAPASGQALRIALNRVLFRTMLLTTGTVTTAMCVLLPNKDPAWRLASLQARTLARLLGVRVRVRGRERLGAGPYVFTPNHESLFDIVALLGFLGTDVRFAAKAELFEKPGLGTLFRTMGLVPVARDKPEEAVRRLGQLDLGGRSIVIFPEGTRSRDGRLLPFKKGPFVTAIRLGVPVVPVACRGTRQVMPAGGRLAIIPGDVEVVVLEPVPTAGMTFDDRDRLRDLVRERIAAELARPAAPAPAG